MLIRLVDDRNLNKILIAKDNIVTPWIELAVTSKKVSTGRKAASIAANSERGEGIAVTASFENVSERKNTLNEFNVNDEFRGTSRTR